MYWQEKEKTTVIRNGPTLGDHYLHGFADGFNGRQRAKPRGKHAGEAYNRGFEAGQATKKPGTARAPGK